MIVNFLKLNYLFHCKLDDLSYWEQEFVSNLVLNQFKNKARKLSEKQIQKIDEIYLHQRGIKLRAKNSHHYLTAQDYTYDEVHNFDR